VLFHVRQALLMNSLTGVELHSTRQIGDRAMDNLDDFFALYPLNLLFGIHLIIIEVDLCVV
jgi:hypothetical protein